MELYLLLAPAGDRRPSSGEPFLLESVLHEPPPPALPTRSHLLDLTAEADSLPKQRWALVVPSGERGERLASLLEPLCALRSEQQGAPVEVFSAPMGQDAEAARKFREQDMQPSSKRSRDQARYVLLAGGPELLSHELQDELSGDGASFVGRLAFEREEDYAAYAAKVVDRETRAPGARRARALLLSVDDGSTGMLIGHEYLVAPVTRICQQERKLNEFPVTELIQERLLAGSSERLLELAGGPAPGVLFTVSHGLGAPAAGWGSAEAQRRRQGALFLGDGAELTPEEVGQRPFMPGGIWFYFACFGAGTPQRSPYLPWMKRLRRKNLLPEHEMNSVRSSFPQDGQSFVAALPQAALANPEGPLAVIAHLDMAWAAAFHNAQTGRSHAGRFVEVLTSLVKGQRAGVALSLLSRFALQVDGVLQKQYQAAVEARPLLDPLLRARLWMERHDLRSYVVLGDPAARLVLG